MIRLVNGRGQLGERLKEVLHSVEDIENDIYVYHTWNWLSKDYETQKNEYLKFERFIEKHINDRVVLISTISENDNYYVYFKQMAEAHLLKLCKNSLVLRLPNLIGSKGILKLLKDGVVEPYGVIELLSIEKAAQEVINHLQYDGLSKIISIKGEKVPAELISKIFKGVK
jgi:hypothetical protein